MNKDVETAEGRACSEETWNKLWIPKKVKDLLYNKFMEWLIWLSYIWQHTEEPKHDVEIYIHGTSQKMSIELGRLKSVSVICTSNGLQWMT